jgi:hypothetical protein
MLRSVLSPGRDMVMDDWPEGISQLGEFLRAQGLSFQRIGIVSHTGDQLWQYGTDKIAVRVIADRGMVWSAQVADIAGWPQEWYSAVELLELLRGRQESSSHDASLSVTEGMKIIQENWAAIVDAFAPHERTKTHTRLKELRIERAKRAWGDYTSY